MWQIRKNDYICRHRHDFLRASVPRFDVSGQRIGLWRIPRGFPVIRRRVDRRRATARRARSDTQYVTLRVIRYHAIQKESNDHSIYRRRSKQPSRLCIASRSSIAIFSVVRSPPSHSSIYPVRSFSIPLSLSHTHIHTLTLSLSSSFPRSRSNALPVRVTSVLTPLSPTSCLPPLPSLYTRMHARGKSLRTRHANIFSYTDVHLGGPAGTMLRRLHILCPLLRVAFFSLPFSLFLPRSLWFTSFLYPFCSRLPFHLLLCSRRLVERYRSGRENSRDVKIEICVEERRISV